MSFIVREALESDLGGVFDVFYYNEIAGIDIPPTRGAIPPDLWHIFRTGSIYVSEEPAEITGFAAAIQRDGTTFLTDLFVRAGSQSTGRGRALLAAALPANSPWRCTVSSTDPRALALYIRAGLTPRWPHFNLTRSSQVKASSQQHDVEVESANVDDPALVAWDKNISGRNRPADHAFWVREQGALPLWFKRHGQTLGYGYVRPGARSILNPDACVIGPVGVAHAVDAVACVHAAVGVASRYAASVHIDVPASHPALAPLLAAGFQIDYTETFLSSSPTPFFDPERYIPSGSNLF